MKNKEDICAKIILHYYFEGYLTDVKNFSRVPKGGSDIHRLDCFIGIILNFRQVQDRK